MFKWLRRAVVLAGLVLVAACSNASPSGTPTSAPVGGFGTPMPVGSSGSGGGSGVGASAGSSTGAAAPGALDPCALLTQTEVAAATGKSVGAGVSQNDGQQCLWEYADPSDQFSGLDASFAINVDPEVVREEQQGGPLVKVVSGLGDEAYFDEAGIVVILDFRKGSQLFEVGMNVAGSLKDQFPPATQEAVEKQMALAALKRIP